MGHEVNGFKIYGNWCGPNYGAGQSINIVDEGCRAHDQCVAEIGPDADPVRGVDGDGTHDDMDACDIEMVKTQRNASVQLAQKRPRGWMVQRFWSWVVRLPFVVRLWFRGKRVK